MYVDSFSWLLSTVAQRVAGLEARPLSRRRKATLALAGLGFPCMAWGYFVEPYLVQVTHTRLTSPRLAGATRPVRLVLISDVHSNAQPRLEEKLPAVIAAERPDLIVFAGDATNAADGVPVFQALMRRLVAIAPVYAVRGNWDAHAGYDALAGTGAIDLRRTVVPLEVAGARLVVAGVGFDSTYAIPDVLRAVPNEGFRIFVHHWPDEIEAVEKRGLELYLAGHTHGGQVALPLYGAIVTLSSYGLRFARGLHQVGPTTLYVTRGIGMEGGHAPRVRFCARPEVTVLELAP